MDPTDILDAYTSAFVGDPGSPEPPPDDTPPTRNGHHFSEIANRTERPVLAGQLLTRAALRSLPDPEPLIDNVLDKGTNALLYGKHGTLKSFTAFDWAASVGTGRKWQGRQTEKGRVLYIAAEGALGTKGRTDAWETGWQTTIADTGELEILGRPVNLTKPLEVANLAALISWGGYDFVIIDTLARCMVGADENSAKDCGIVVEAMTQLLGQTPHGRGVILGIHHAGKDGKTFRGSSVFEAGADTVYSSIRDGGVITLTREKRKDGPEHDRHELKLDPVKGTNSAVISVHRGVGPVNPDRRHWGPQILLAQRADRRGSNGSQCERTLDNLAALGVINLGIYANKERKHGW
jgi:hypothetical protein